MLATLSSTSSTQLKLSPELVVRLYLAALEMGSYRELIRLFAPGAIVESPLYGVCEARSFYRELLEDTGSSTLTLNGVFTGATDAQAIGYFRYDWVLADGTPYSFDCCDVFDFDDDGRIVRLKIIYDTYPVRSAHQAVKESREEVEVRLEAAFN